MTGTYECYVSDPTGGSLPGIRVDPMRRPTTPPRDAIVLFDGSSLDGWMKPNGDAAAWTLEDDAMTVRGGTGSIQSKAKFEDFMLHVEFKCPDGVAPEVRGQARSNSGVYLHGSYEVQVFGFMGPAAADQRGWRDLQRASAECQCITQARANGKTYDIEFIAPRFDDTGSKLSDARLTVIHNGVVIHRDVIVTGSTGSG